MAIASDVKNSLPKLNGIVQPDFTTKIPAKKNEEGEENIQDTLAFKLALAQALEPPVDLLFGEGKGGGGSSQATMAQLIAQAEQLISIKSIAKEMKDLTAQTKKAQQLQAFTLHGKEVGLDDSVRSLNKNDKAVEFKYDLKYPPMAPDNTKAQCNIEILNSQNIVVFSAKRDGVKGSNTFNWDAKDSKGNLVELGDYKIRVSATFGAGARYGNIESSSVIRGIVEAVSLKDGKTMLRVNGQNVDYDKIIELGSNSKISVPKPSINELINYKNKEVEVDIAKIQVENGKAEILYNNDDIENPGDLRLDIYGSNGEYIKTISYDKLNIENGIGSFTLDAKAEEIPDGSYTTKIAVLNNDNKSYSLLTNTKVNITVESIDVANAKLNAGGKSYDARSIVNVLGESNLYTLGAQFMGKKVQYINDEFKFNPPNYDFITPVSSVPAGREMGEAELRIFKGNKMVALRNITPNEPTAIPAFNDLNAASKLIVRDYIAEEVDPAILGYRALRGAQKKQTDDFIAQQFRSGKLFGVAQDPNDQATVNINKGIGGIISFDGHLEDGTTAKDGESFKYELWTSTTALDGTDLMVERVYQSAEGFVVKHLIENNSLMLELSNGEKIPYLNVEKVG